MLELKPLNEKPQKHAFLKRSGTRPRKQGVNTSQKMPQNNGLVGFNKGMTYAQKGGKSNVILSKKKLLVPPGGHSSLDLFSQTVPDIPDPRLLRKQSLLRPLSHENPHSSPFFDRGTVQHVSSKPFAEDERYGQRSINNSSNAYANGSNQNSGNVITERSSTRLHAPPGGQSSFSLAHETSPRRRHIDPISNNVHNRAPSSSIVPIATQRSGDQSSQSSTSGIGALLKKSATLRVDYDNIKSPKIGIPRYHKQDESRGYHRQGGPPTYHKQDESRGYHRQGGPPNYHKQEGYHRQGGPPTYHKQEGYQRQDGPPNYHKQEGYQRQDGSPNYLKQEGYQRQDGLPNYHKQEGCQRQDGPPNYHKQEKSRRGNAKQGGAIKHQPMKVPGLENHYKDIGLSR